MNYRTPLEVTRPRDLVEVIEVIHVGGEEGCSIARINWDGNPVIGVRWNVAQREWDDETKQREERACVGMPSSRGNPVWFVLPEELLDKESDAWAAIERSLQPD